MATFKGFRKLAWLKWLFALMQFEQISQQFYESRVELTQDN